MDQKKIGKFIAEERKKQNLTQAELAEILGVSDKSVSKWKNVLIYEKIIREHSFIRILRFISVFSYPVVFLTITIIILD